MNMCSYFRCIIF